MKVNHLKNSQTFLKRRVKKYYEFAQLAMISCMEYRFNFLIDIFLQPIVGVLVELTLWASIFTTSSSIQIGGFSIEYYLSYVIWAGG